MLSIGEPWRIPRNVLSDWATRSTEPAARVGAPEALFDEPDPPAGPRRKAAEGFSCLITRGFISDDAFTE